MPHISRNLVIVPAGDDSQHTTWAGSRGERPFDLAIVYFGRQPGTHRETADYYFERRGFKFHLIDYVLDELGDRLQAYEQIWCPDDDLAATPGDVRELFRIAAAYSLAIAQPAISSGDVSYRALRQQPGLRLRYTGFVETMCPLFSRAALDRVRPTFLENRSAWGLDWAWSTLLPRDQLAVIDAVAVHHLRPLYSGAGYARMREQGIDPSADLREMLQRYPGSGRYFRRQIKYGTARVRAIDVNGRPTWAGPPWWLGWRRSA